MKLSMVCGLALLILFSGAFVQEQKKPEPCADAQSQAEMNFCWGNEYKAADARLNEAYRQFASKLDDAEKAQLKNAQLAWLKYRDANCDFVADQYKVGTIRPMIGLICTGQQQNRS